MKLERHECPQERKRDYNLIVQMMEVISLCMNYHCGFQGMPYGEPMCLCACVREKGRQKEVTKIKIIPFSGT